MRNGPLIRSRGVGRAGNAASRCRVIALYGAPACWLTAEPLPGLGLAVTIAGGSVVAAREPRGGVDLFASPVAAGVGGAPG